jgi:atypical dual specificity phosphatase
MTWTFGSVLKVPRQAWTYARSKPVSWLEDGRVAACRYPRDERALRDLADAGVRLIVNLHPRAHRAEQLSRLNLRELHLPVADFTPPSAEQLDTGVAAIREAVASGESVAVHCGGGLGRTGTLVACYLVDGGLSADAAIAEVRRFRPGSVETPAQEAAVRAFAERGSRRA